MHRVVIVGGGFGGLYTAQALKDLPVDVTLLDRRNFHLFQPLLYQVATGSLSPGEVASPLRSTLRKQRNARVLLAEAVDFDVPGRRVILREGSVEYDTLIVAAGARNFYFGHDEWSAVAPALKSIEDATAIRHKILFAFEAAERETDPEKRRAWLTFVVVGAGATGVELSGALGEIAHDTLRHDFRSIDSRDARILLIDGARVLPPYPLDLAAAAERSLIKLGVRARTGVRVTNVDEHGVDIESANGTERVEARTVLWAAGVRASELGAVLATHVGAQVDKQGRVPVHPDLTLPGHPEIFVIGDLASCPHPDGKPLPGVAPVAMQQGRYAARLIGARLKGGTSPPPFHYHDKGSLAVIGRASAVADFGRLRFHGLTAWLLWLFIHLMYIVEFENRLIVFLRWGIQYLTYSRGARLITGPGDLPGGREESETESVTKS
ncbi:MAG: NAD(P)/FAD-dependent oxidoreductase [Bryobacteraceae bacterium]